MNLSNLPMPGGGRVILSFVFAVICGCSHPDVVTVERFIEFEQAGPVTPKVDMEKVIQARQPEREYRLVVGDVIDFSLPMDLLVTDLQITYMQRQDRYHRCRVDRKGRIQLPILAPMEAAGKTLTELEEEIAAAYYPRYLSYRPSVVGQVVQYHTEDITIVGAVKQPGTYKCRSDEMTLVNLLMKAGGFSDEGAVAIRIRTREAPEAASEPLVLPVKGLRIPFEDIQLARGAIVEVEPVKPDVFTVIGLVKNPGAYPYPPNVRYNLLQALAYGGGVNEVADPRYIRVYRQNAKGEIVDATFKIGGEGVADAAGVQIKPGDVISVEQTQRTRTRILLSEVVRVTFGINLSGWYRYLEGKDVTTRESN